MHDPLRDALTVEVSKLLDQMEVSQQDWTTLVDRQRVERVAHWRAAVGRWMGDVKHLARSVLLGVHGTRTLRRRHLPVGVRGRRGAMHLGG